MREPSTNWQEQIEGDEEQRFAEYGRLFSELAREKAAKYGKGRALHRKQLAGLRGKLEVLPGLPAHAAHGLFARPATYDAWVRLSNGSADRQSDSRPDVRGFALKVRGLDPAPSALGGTTTEQDFLLINFSTFAFPKSEEFVALAMAASRGPLALIGHLTGRHGLLGGLSRAADLARSMARPFGGFAAETVHSAAPIQCGPYAVKVRLTPSKHEKYAVDGRAWGSDLIGRLVHGPLSWDLKLQFFVDEQVTPIEDASVEWPDRFAPVVTVARLTLPQRPISTEVFEEIEAAKFDPWNALADHRPLGEIMRARKAAYYASQQARGLG